MTTISEQEKDKIKDVFTTINIIKISALESNTELFENIWKLQHFLSKDTYENETALEKGYTAFKPYIFQAWERLYLVKFLNEFDLLDSTSTMKLLFILLTLYLVNGTDGSESCRRDTLAFRNGKIIECGFNFFSIFKILDSCFFIICNFIRI